MAKAKTTKATTKKPATKKPSKPAKAVKPVKEKPVALKVLKTDGPVMTEKKLKKHTANGVTSFLLSFKLADLLNCDDKATTLVTAEATKAAVPVGYYIKDYGVKPFAIGKNGKIELLIDATIVPIAKLAASTDEPKAEDTTPIEVPHGSGYGGVPTGEEHRAAGEAEPADANADDTVLAASTPEYKFEPVMAELVSDDHVQRVSFDCQDWFKQATDEDILELAREGYAHDFTSDRLAEFFKETNAEVKTVFDYLDTLKDVPEKKDVNGFGCTVNEDQAVSWVDANRPQLLDQLAKIKDGEEAEKPE